MAVCRSCDKIRLSVTNSVTKLSFRITSTVTRTSISLVEEKKWLLRGPRKCVAIRRFFHPRKSLHFILNHSKLHCFFQPSETCILPSISVYADACLVWLVYLIHELDWTSKWSFFFNQKDPNYSIVRFNKELNLKRVSSKTVKDWCGKPVFRGYFLFCCLPEPFL